MLKIIQDDTTIGDHTTIGDDTTIGDGIEIIQGIFIAGSKHFVTWTGKDTISIGCMNFTFAQWSEKFGAIGKNEGYDVDQISEYKAYIDLIIKLKSDV